MKTKGLIAGIFAFALAVDGSATISKGANNWRKAGGSADGSWTDVSHWTENVLPDYRHIAIFPGNLGSYTVTFPAGNVDVATSFRANVNTGETIVFDGENSSFLQGTRETETYCNEPFGFRFNNAHFFNHQQYSGSDSAIATHAFSEMTNFVIRLSGAGKGPSLEFESGSLNLYDPCSSEPWSAYTILFAQSLTAGADALPYEGRITFGAGTATRFGEVLLQGNNRTNILEFTGGRHEFLKQVSVPNAGQSMTSKAAETVIRVADGAEVVFSGALNFGSSSTAYGNTAERTAKLLVENGGFCAVSNTLTQLVAGRFEIDVRSGGSLDLVGNASLATLSSCTASVSVADAELRSDGELNLGNYGNFILDATNSTIDLTSAKYTQTSGESLFVDSTVLAGSENFTLMGRDTEMTFAGDDSRFDLEGPLYVGNSSAGDATLVFDGGVHVLKGSMYIGHAGTGTVNVCSGSVTNKGSGNSFTYMGLAKSAHGILSVSGGEFTAPDNYGIQIGWTGSGEMEVSGGKVVTKRIRLGSDNSSSTVPYDVFRQSGGEVKIDDYKSEYGLYAAVCALRTAKVFLDGGVMKCGRFAGGEGNSYFSADGGTISVPVATETLFYGWTSAELGKKGLTVDSDFDVTVAQDFTSKSDGGRLTLRGTGVKTFTGTGTSLTDLEIYGCRAVFPSRVAKLGNVTVGGGAVLAFDGDPSDSAVKSLTIGDETGSGIIEVVPGKPIKVNGDVTVIDAKIVLNGEFPSGENGTDYTLVEFTGSMSAESESRWIAAYTDSGIAEGDAVDFRLVEVDGTKRLSAFVRKARNPVITLESGTSNATENVSFAFNETLRVEVGEGATLYLDGGYAYGRLDKHGAGRAYLTGADNCFRGGLRLCGGLLSVLDPVALGLDAMPDEETLVISNGTLEITGPAAGVRLERAIGIDSERISMTAGSFVFSGRDAVIVKNEVPLSMPVPSPATAAFMKRGTAEMVIESAADTTFPAERGHDNFGYEPAASTCAFDDFGTVPENYVYPALSVVEGCLKLKGVAEEPVEFGINGSIMLSLPSKQVSVQPSLALDNAKLVNKGDGTRAHIGFCNNNSSLSSVSSVTLSLTNNSVFSADTVNVNKSSSAGARARIEADSSKFIATYLLNAGYGNEPDIVYSFRNGSALLANSFSLNSRVTFDFDASVFAKNTSLAPLTVKFYANSAHSFNFRNGSEFRCNLITNYNAALMNSATVFTFENSRWIPGDVDFVFASHVMTNLQIAVEGAGLVLEPPAGRTWELRMPVSGDGGIVVGGEGRVVLDGEKWSAQGAARINSGSTLDLDGTVVEGLYVTGGGTLTGGTVRGGGVAVALKKDGTLADDAIPVLDGVLFSGPVRVRPELVEGTLSAPYRAVAVARYEGDAPDVASWRMAKQPSDRALGAKFSAKDGKIYMTPGHYGMVLIVR